MMQWTSAKVDIDMEHFEIAVNQAAHALRELLPTGHNSFFSTSFGRQSELMFFLLAQANVKTTCVHVRSPLSIGGVDQQKEYLLSKYSVSDYVEIDRSEWVSGQLEGREFLDLNTAMRIEICRHLKREPIAGFVEKYAKGIWLTAIRSDQTGQRRHIKFVESSDLGVTKVAPMKDWDKEFVDGLFNVFSLQSNNQYVDMCKFHSGECGLHSR